MVFEVSMILIGGSIFSIIYCYNKIKFKHSRYPCQTKTLVIQPYCANQPVYTTVEEPPPPYTEK